MKCQRTSQIPYPKKTLRGVRVFRSVGSFKPRPPTNKCILDDTPGLDCNESAERGIARGVVQQRRDTKRLSQKRALSSRN